jgi:aubergine-like protein
MRGAELRSAMPLDSWMILFTSRDSGIAQDFLQTLQRVCGPMGIQVSKPMMYVLGVCLKAVFHFKHIVYET